MGKEAYNSITKDLFEYFYSKKDGNFVYSPLSILTLIALAGDATGGDTRKEIEDVFNKIDQGSLEEVAVYLKNLQDELTLTDSFMASNAVCIRGDLTDSIIPDYGEHLKEKFAGNLFSSENMVEDINSWVDQNTKGMIREIADESMNRMLASFLNAVSFKSRWKDEYEYDDVVYKVFHNSDGSENEISMLISTEDLYVEDKDFIGFVKPYKDAGYSFMALLPKIEGKNIEKKELHGADFLKLFQTRQLIKVKVNLPEFRCEYDDELRRYLQKKGINLIFSPGADFSGMINEDIMVDQIIHKACIQVDRNGTEAAAVTMTAICAGCWMEPEYKEVIIDRPFIFAIIHNATGLPVFVGNIKHLEKGNFRFVSEELHKSSFEPEPHEFKSVEERHEFAKRIYRRIAGKLHPDFNPHFEESEELQLLFKKATDAYSKYDVRTLEIIEHDLPEILARYEQEEDIKQ